MIIQHDTIMLHYYSLHIVNSYTHNISAAIFFSLLQVPLVVFSNFLGILNLTLYLNHGDRLSIVHHPVGILLFLIRTRDWTHNLQVVVCYNIWLDMLTLSVVCPGEQFRLEDNEKNNATICLPNVRGMSEKLERIYSSYNIKMICRNSSTLWGHLFKVKHLKV